MSSHNLSHSIALELKKAGQSGLGTTYKENHSELITGAITHITEKNQEGKKIFIENALKH